jgi:hypothetical protein
MSIQVGTALSVSPYAAVAASKRSAGASAEPASTGGVDTVTLSQAAAGRYAGEADYTRMTPAQMKDAAQGLYDAGKIDLSELFMLQTAGMPLGKAGPNGEFLALSAAEKARFNAQPVNYIQTFKDGIDHLEQTGYANDPTSGHARMKHLLEVLQRAQV